MEKQYWPELPKVYVELVVDKPKGLLQSYLAQDKKQPGYWRIMTFWEHQEALDAMRASGQTPAGVMIFRQVNAQPTLRVLEIMQTKN